MIQYIDGTMEEMEVVAIQYHERILLHREMRWEHDELLTLLDFVLIDSNSGRFFYLSLMGERLAMTHFISL